MNLLLLEPDEVDREGRVTLTDRRFRHAVEVLRAASGDELRVGVRGGQRGLGRVVQREAQALVLQVTLTEPPPVRPRVDVLLAIPRPKALKRVLSTVASLGVDRVMLINAARVEKSYFDSKVLDASFIREQLDLGLEQACDTVAPTIEVRERFKPFIEDELSAWAGDARRLVMHPGPDDAWPSLEPRERLLIAVGPDGGWVPFEIELLRTHGFAAVAIGPRPLRVEVAVPATIAALRPRLGA